MFLLKQKKNLLVLNQNVKRLKVFLLYSLLVADINRTLAWLRALFIRNAHGSMQKQSKTS